MRSPFAAILMFGGATASPHSLAIGASLFALGLLNEVAARWPRGPRQP